MPNGFGYGVGVDLAPAQRVLWQRVEDPGGDAAVAETGLGGEPGQGAGLGGDPDGQRRPVDGLGVAALAVDLQPIPAVAFEEHAEVGRGGVAGAGEGGERIALGGEDGDAAAVLGQQRHTGLGGHVVRGQPRQFGDGDGGGFLGGRQGIGHRLGRVRDDGLGGLGRVFGAGLGDPCGQGGFDLPGSGFQL